MDGFSKGKIIYDVLTMVGQVVAWQIYWVGLVGLVVFADSIMISNVISLSTDLIVIALKIFFCNYEFDGFLGGSLALYAIAVASCFYKPGFLNWKMPRLLQVLLLFVVLYFYISKLLECLDPYISPPTRFEFI